MKRQLYRHGNRAFAIVDLLIVIVTVALFVGWFMPSMARHTSYPIRMHCVNNLRQVGVGFRIYSSDHEEEFPWHVSTNKGGSMEFVNTRDVFRHFLVASNELSSPKILFCPEDQRRSRVDTFDKLSNSNLSYFVGLDADPARHAALLSGDRTISTTQSILSGLLILTTNLQVQWAKGLHKSGGNICFADGSVSQLSTTGLQGALQNTGVATNRLVLP